MIISILTLFPEIFPPIFSSSIIGRAQKKGLLTFRYINIRDFGLGRHKIVDDKLYGGGVGMLMRVDVVAKAIAFAKSQKSKASNTGKDGIREQDEFFDRSVIRNLPYLTQSKNIASKKNLSANEFPDKKTSRKEKVVLLDPAGKVFTQSKARTYSRLSHLILVCGHYEGIDARIKKHVDESVSIGQYVLTGGELPAMVISDCVARLVPGVLPPEAVKNESYTDGKILEARQYTRPVRHQGLNVPRVLLSGNHQEIENWKKNEALKRSK